MWKSEKSGISNIIYLIKPHVYLLYMKGTAKIYDWQTIIQAGNWSDAVPKTDGQQKPLTPDVRGFHQAGLAGFEPAK